MAGFVAEFSLCRIMAVLAVFMLTLLVNIHTQALPPAKKSNSKKDFAPTTDFAFDLYREIAKNTDGSKNIFFSPLSVYVALAMLQAGAKSHTKTEMDKVMHLQQLTQNSKYQNGHTAIKELLSGVFGPLGNNNTVSLANKLWLQKYFCSSLCDNFINILKTKYGAELGELNFVTDAENSRNAINKWVAEQTKDKIKELMAKGTVSSLTRFVLTNAIYFKSKWKHQFDKKNTMELDFTTMINGKLGTKRVPTMYQNAKFYAAGFVPSSPFQLLELPYEDESLSMLIILPSNPNSFQRLEKVVSANDFEGMLRDLYEYPRTNLDVYMPKFKVSTKLDLKDILGKMGMNHVFNPRHADLSGITGFRGMYVSDAVHQAFVNVDEEGTEAAAATGIVVSVLSSSAQLIVNRPFVFLVKHKATGTILFMGRVIDPTAKN